MSGERFDLVILGSGGAAFGAALRASELGAKVAMIERSTLGGTCVNTGCIPSKTLLRAAEALHRARATPFDGLDVSGRLADFRAVMAQKQRLVEELRQTKYADVLAAIPNLSFIHGHAQFVAAGELGVGADRWRADRFLVATGARPYVPPIPGLRDAGFLTSTGALSLAELPPSLVVIGGRYVALELAQALSRLGARVTVLQRSAHLLPTEDADVTDALADYLRAEAIEILTGVEIERVWRDGPERVVEFGVQGERRTVRAAQVLAATGRQPNTDDLGLDRIGVALDERGAIRVDEQLQTSVPGVYAAGDVKGDPAFIYTAAYEGRLAAENALTGAKRARHYTGLPWVMFTDPQLAVVGLDEGRARREGLRVEVARLPLSQVPRALAARDTRGFVKLVKQHGTDRLVGASVVAPEAGDLIMEPALAIRYRLGVSALADAFHPYLTQSEAIKLAAQAFSKDVAKLSCCAP